MYSTGMGYLGHEEQVKDGYRRSNKNNTAQSILSYYGRKHVLGMSLQMIEQLAKAEKGLVMGNGGLEALASSWSGPRRVPECR